MPQYAWRMVQKVSPRAQAIAAQLKAEIAAGPMEYNSIPKVAKALDLEYTTFYRRVNGNLPLQLDLVFEVLEMLGVNERQFWEHAIDRIGDR